MAAEALGPLLLQQAEEAAKAKEYDRAVDLYTQAAEADPTAAAPLAGRAFVHNKLNNHMEAAADASRAAELDDKLAAAFKEMGLAYFHLDEFESALDAFESARALEPAKRIHAQWADMCRVQLGETLPPPPSIRGGLQGMLQGGAPPADEAAGAAGAEGAAGGSGGGGDGRGISLSGDELKAFLAKIKAGGGGGGGGGTGLPPQLEQLVAQQQQQQRRQQEEEAEAGSQQPKAATVDDPEFAKYWKAPVAAALAAAVPDKPAGAKYRHQWLQSGERVEVGVLARGLQAQQVSVTIEAQRLRVATTSLDGQPEYELDVALHAPVVPEESRFDVLGSKVEVRLKKARPGEVWPQLEHAAGDKAAVGAAGSGAAAAAGPASPSPAVQPNPVYPYAGKKVDWDKFADQLKKEEKEEKVEGEQGLLKFFRELYKGGDENTQRAMLKSMQESGGTALSMNWNEVSTKDYAKPEHGKDDA